MAGGSVAMQTGRRLRSGMLMKAMSDIARWKHRPLSYQRRRRLPALCFGPDKGDVR
jgi:hypothetical protein